MSVAASWRRIEQWHQSNAPEGEFVLNSSASANAIDELEQTIGKRLPDDFRESLSVHDGGDDVWLLPTHGELHPVADIISKWRMYCDWQQSGEYANPTSEDWIPANIRGPIKPFFWSPLRLFVSDNSGDHVTLDLDPPENGVYGQVLYHCHEVGPEAVLAPSWSAYLELVADELESGKYYYNDEYGCIDGPQ